MFTTPLDLRAHTPGRWYFLAPLVWVRDDERIEVPTNFITDLASIPRLLRWLFDRNGRSRRAAALHDWLYAMQTTTRWHADWLFLEALAEEGMRRIPRTLYWLGVVVGGWWAWRQNGKRPITDFFVVKRVTTS
jgi:hypothetical protein